MSMRRPHDFAGRPLQDDDSREPPQWQGTGEPETRLVWHPWQGEYLVQSPGRMQRREEAHDCPFCADLRLGRVPPDTQAWIRPNDFPALRPPVGECFVLIYSAEHERTFADLRPDEAGRVIGLWQDLYAELAPRYACVMTWETSGAVIGQTQRHPHGQAYGVAVVPPMLARELESIKRSHVAGNGCPFCTFQEAEQRGPRVVTQTPHWLAFVPPFARYPYEVHVVARRHVSSVGMLPRAGEEVHELAVLLPRLIRVYNQVFAGPMPYMLAVHQLEDERFHLHVELLPVGRAPGKLKLAASSEMAWGLWLNDALPETTAAELRSLYAALPSTDGAHRARASPSTETRAERLRPS
jgi:UDPglucose--hexose-1-phosphate uridylyltransferase